LGSSWGQSWGTFWGQVGVLFGVLVGEVKKRVKVGVLFRPLTCWGEKNRVSGRSRMCEKEQNLYRRVLFKNGRFKVQKKSQLWVEISKKLEKVEKVN